VVLSSLFSIRASLLFILAGGQAAWRECAFLPTLKNYTEERGFSLCLYPAMPQNLGFAGVMDA